MQIKEQNVTGYYILQLIPVQYFSFANSDAANTGVEIIIPKQERPAEYYQLHIYNPSTESDLSLYLFDMIDFESDVRYKDCHLDHDTCPKSQSLVGRTVDGYTFSYSFAFLPNDIKLRISNDTELGESGAFTGALTLFGVYQMTK